MAPLRLNRHERPAPPDDAAVSPVAPGCGTLPAGAGQGRAAAGMGGRGGGVSA